MSREPEDNRKRRATDEDKEAAGDNNYCLRLVKKPPFSDACRDEQSGPAQNAKNSSRTEQEIDNLKKQLEEALKQVVEEKQRADLAETRITHFQREMTIYGLLQMVPGNNDRLRLSFLGLPSTRANSSHWEVAIQPKEFMMPSNILSYLGDTVTKELSALRNTSSLLLATTRNYFLRVAKQEADICARRCVHCLSSFAKGSKETWQRHQEASYSSRKGSVL
jgi:hypothetical protein